MQRREHEPGTGTTSGNSDHVLFPPGNSLALDLSPPAESFTIDDALARIGTIQDALQSIEDIRLKLKWCLGFVLAHTDRPRGSAKSVVEAIASRLREERDIRTNKADLYRCERVYRSFAGDFTRFTAWIDDRKSLFDRPVYWSDVLEHVIGGRNNPDVIGREAANRNDLLDVERSIEKLEKIVLRAYQDDDESAGAIEGIRQSTEGMRLLHQHTQDSSRNQTPLRDQEYIRFVRSHGCLICNMPAEAHHAFGERGTGIKTSDYTCIPLCTMHHRELHSRGRRRFLDLYEVDVFEVAFNLIHRFMTGRWVSKRLDAGSASDGPGAV